MVLKTMPIMVTTSQGITVDPFPFAAVKIAIDLNTLHIQLEYRLKHQNWLDIIGLIIISFLNFSMWGSCLKQNILNKRVKMLVLRNNKILDIITHLQNPFPRSSCLI